MSWQTEADEERIRPLPWGKMDKVDRDILFDQDLRRGVYGPVGGLTHAARTKVKADLEMDEAKREAERLLEEVDYDIRKERGWAKTPEADKEHGLPDTLTERAFGPDPYEPEAREDVGQGEDDFPG